MSVLPASSGYDYQEVAQSREPKPLEDFCEYAYDFEKNELKTRDGKHYYVYGNEAMKIWIYKAMITARFRYTAYSGRFGTEVYSLIGEVVSDKLKREEIKRYITESIMVHPHIRAITDMKLERVGAGIEVTVWVKTAFEGEVEPVTCLVKIW